VRVLSERRRPVGVWAEDGTAAGVWANRTGVSVAQRAQAKSWERRETDVRGWVRTKAGANIFLEGTVF
jgi:hypothetical protein